jgi:phosphonate transport system substrate-binding protein
MNRHRISRKIPILARLALTLALLMSSCDSTTERVSKSMEPAEIEAPTSDRAAPAVSPMATATTPSIALTVGVVPQQAASRLASIWVPILERVGREAGVKLTFKTASDIPTFEDRVARGEYDIAYMNPYHYTVFHEEPGYEAIARRSDKRIRGIIVTQRGSGISSLRDLDGQDIAFPAPRAFAATLLTRAAIDAEGIEYTPHFVSSHDSVYLNVARGTFSAGGGIMRTFNSISDEVRDQLDILLTTEGYTPHALAAHPRVDQQLLAKITDALTRLDGDDEGRNLLSALDIKSFAAATDSEWDDVRSLRIQAP